MASSTTPTRMEDEHFGNVGNKSDIKVNDKTISKDFINTETGRYNVDIEFPAQHSIKADTPVKDESKTESKNIHKEQNSSSNPDSKVVDVLQVYDDSRE